MATNQFYTWASAPQANALTPTAYYALTTLRATGFQPGVASSEQINTVLRQVTTVSAAVGAFVNLAGRDVLDNGDPVALRDSIVAAVRYAVKIFVPVGTVITSYLTSAPEGFFEARGHLVSRAEFHELFDAMVAAGLVVSESAWETDRAKFSSGDGVSTFRLPDLRGVHIRYHDGGRGLDPFREMATYQADQLPAHTHAYRKGTSTAGAQTSGEQDPNMARAWDDNSATGSAGTGTEVRVKNVALKPYIKY